MNKKDKLALCVPAFFAALFDTAITISYQAKEYWQGNLEKANEGNPIGALFMRNHVSGIFVISIVWLVLIVTLGYYLPTKIGRVFLLFVLIAHSWGASTWISKYYGFWYVMVFILFNSILFYVIKDFAHRNNLVKEDNALS